MTTRAPRTLLTSNDVRAVLATRAVEHPITMPEIADLCRSAHPTYSGITTSSVRVQLRYLHRRSEVVCFSGTDDAAQLHALGIEPHPRRNYWMLARLWRGRYAYPHHER